MKMASDMSLDYDDCKDYLHKTNINEDYLKFHSPSRIIVYGQTGSGKTTLVCKILTRHKQLFVFPLANIMYLNPMAKKGSPYYPHSTVNYLRNTFPKMTIGTTVPASDDSDFEAWIEKHRLRNGELAHLALLIDDFQDYLHLLERPLQSLFVRFSRHGNITIFVTMQNPSVGGVGGAIGRAVRCMRNNCNYVIVFDNTSCPSLLGYIEKMHDPLREGTYTHSGRTLRRCLNEAEQWLSSSHAYVVCNFNLHNKMRPVFPLTSCIVGEIHEKVLALCWWSHDYTVNREDQQDKPPPNIPVAGKNNNPSAPSSEDENNVERCSSQELRWSPSISELSDLSDNDDA